MWNQVQVGCNIFNTKQTSNHLIIDITECHTINTTVEYVEEECSDNYVKACEARWEVVGGVKVWVPDTSKCQNLVSNQIFLGLFED